MNNIDPSTPRDVEQLEAQLSAPDGRVVETMAGLSGDVMVLGVGGKMGPTLARMAKRATDEAGVSRRIIGVSRFSDADLRPRLESHGIETIACDLLDEEAVGRLPDVENIVFMAGMKFGATGNPGLTWAMNCHVPAIVCKRFRESRLAVFSSGNVYGMAPTSGRGSRETDELRPVGEYAMTVLGRERMFEYFSRRFQIPVVLLRLNYATELRYGVLVDMARRVLAGEPIDVSMGYTNVIWQAEANAQALASLRLASTPAKKLNIAGPEVLRVADVCRQFADLLGKQLSLTGTEGPDAFLSDARASYDLLGRPAVSADEMIRWTADWVARGGESLGKPTHFESRDGKY